MAHQQPGEFLSDFEHFALTLGHRDNDRYSGVNVRNGIIKGEC
jgi:hypothetical protein